MKKLLSLLLALALCCSMAAPYAVAEETGRVYRLSEQMNASALGDLLSVLGADVDATTLTAWTKLINSTEIVLHTGCSYASLSLMLAGEEVAQAALFLQDDVIFLTSSLISDAAVSIDVEGLSDALFSGELLLKYASSKLLNLSMDELSMWEASIPVEIDRGLFVGETFSNGRIRTAYRMDDRDAALLLSNLVLAVESDPDLSPLAQEWLGEDWSIRTRETLRQIALNNLYAYELTEICGKTGDLNGLTLHVLRDGQTETQLSAGFSNAQLSEVLLTGYGMTTNYLHCDLTRNLSQNQLVCALDMRQTDRGASYDALVRDGSGEVCGTTVTLQSETRDNAFMQTAALMVSAPTQNGSIQSYGEAKLERSVEAGTFTFTLTDRIGTESSDPWSLLTCTGDSDASFALPELDSLTIFQEEDPDLMAKLDPFVNQGVSELGLNLFRTVPAELMVWFMQWFSL